MAVMQATDIMQVIPHRYPFMLVDRILEINVEEKKIVGLKNLTFNEPFFQGHFPGNPVMPGVLQLEAMAQVGGVLLNELSSNEGQLVFFMAIDNAKFRRVVIPGDQLRFELEITKLRSRLCVVHGKAYVGDELASEADLMFGYGKK